MEAGNSSSDSIATQAIRGSAYGVSAAAVTLTLGFLRAVLLARLLLPEDFGLMTLALFYVNLAGQLRAMSFAQAMIHHPQPDESTLRTYCSLRVATTLVSLVVLVAAIPFLAGFYPAMPLLGRLLLLLTGVEVLGVIAAIQDSLLTRVMAFRTLALADVLASIVMTSVAPLLAWKGWGVWALVAEAASGILARAAYVWSVSPDARPRCGWNGQAARWFWDYARPSWTAASFTFLQERFDDFWVGTTLGSQALGYYSRAYEFARYPRRVVANPLLDVILPTFARVQHDRRRLSQAFFRVTALMVHAGFGFSLAFILAAPEFVQLVLGARWLPMTLTFQLLIVYALLDPLTVGASNLLMAIGHPGLIARVRGLQLLVFVPAVIVFSRLGGIAGVALAADVMVVSGTVLLFRYARRLVDYSARALFLWPAVSLVVTGGLVVVLQPVWTSLPTWTALVAKGTFVTACYAGLLWLVEREQLRFAWRELASGFLDSAPAACRTWKRAAIQRGAGHGNDAGRRP